MGDVPAIRRVIWQTTPVAYHESFWVAVAAAAPVIALANTVAITDAVNVWLETKVRGRSRDSRSAFVSIIGMASYNLLIQHYSSDFTERS